MKFPAALPLPPPPPAVLLLLSLRVGVAARASFDLDMPRLRVDRGFSEASFMISFRSFLVVGNIGDREPQGAAWVDVVFGGVERFMLFFRSARDSVGDSAKRLLLSCSEANFICPSK